MTLPGARPVNGARRFGHRGCGRVGLFAPLLVAVLVAVSCGPEDSRSTTGPTEEVAAQKVEDIITPGRATWSAGYFQAAVYSALLEELGFTVEDPAANEFPPSEAYIAMAENRIDFWANGWYSQHNVWHDATLADGTRVGDRLTVIGQQLEGAGLQGLVITRSVVEQHGITSLAQINDNPDLASLFDVDGNGIADIFGCPEDWTCDNVIDEMIGHNGWTNLEQVKGGYPGMVEATIGRVAAEEPAIQYTWSPSGHVARLVPGENVLWLSMGTIENVLDGSTESGLDYAQFGPAGFGESCSADPCWPGWKVEDIRVTANVDFAADNPIAAALFEIVQLDVEAVTQQNALYDLGENSEEDIRRHADEWIAEHRTLVDEWLAFALRAGS